MEYKLYRLCSQINGIGRSYKEHDLGCIIWYEYSSSAALCQVYLFQFQKAWTDRRYSYEIQNLLNLPKASLGKLVKTPITPIWEHPIPIFSRCSLPMTMKQSTPPYFIWCTIALQPHPRVLLFHRRHFQLICLQLL